MASIAFRGATAKFANKEIDWDTDDIRFMLVRATHAIDKDADVFLSDLDTYRYPGLTQANDASIVSPAINTPATGIVELDCGTVTFTSVAYNTENAVGVVAYRWSGLTTTSQVIAFDEFSVAVTPDGNNIEYSPSANGILRYSH